MPSLIKTASACVFGVLLASGAALAAPPPVGTTHTFLDPVFEGTIICDTIEAVTEIAGADEPDSVYGRYVLTENDIGEPVCLAVVPTAEVKAVTPLGTMHKDGDAFSAWAVEADIDGAVVYALYLERDPSLLV